MLCPLHQSIDVCKSHLHTLIPVNQLAFEEIFLCLHPFSIQDIKGVPLRLDIIGTSTFSSLKSFIKHSYLEALHTSNQKAWYFQTTFLSLKTYSDDNKHYKKINWCVHHMTHIFVWNHRATSNLHPLPLFQSDYN